MDKDCDPLDDPLDDGRPAIQQEHLREGDWINGLYVAYGACIVLVESIHYTRDEIREKARQIRREQRKARSVRKKRLDGGCGPTQE